MATIPDKAEHQRRFMALPFADRRTVIRAVNRGRALDDRKLAVLAVGVARRQKRFWRYAWLIGPAVGIIQFLILPDQPQVALANAAIGTFGLGLVAAWYVSRAAKAEQANLEAAGVRTRERGPGGSTARPARHLPGRAGSEQPTTRTRRQASADDPADTADAEGTDAGTAPLPGMRPYKPRGRKRRSR